MRLHHTQSAITSLIRGEQIQRGANRRSIIKERHQHRIASITGQHGQRPGALLAKNRCLPKNRCLLPYPSAPGNLPLDKLGGLCSMDAAEQWEPDDARVSRPVLEEPKLALTATALNFAAAPRSRPAHPDAANAAASARDCVATCATATAPAATVPLAQISIRVYTGAFSTSD